MYDLANKKWFQQKNNPENNKEILKQKQKIHKHKHIQTEKPNKWITFIYTGNETTKPVKILKRENRNITIAFKTNNKLNNLISNKMEKFSIYGKEEYTN